MTIIILPSDAPGYLASPNDASVNYLGGHMKYLGFIFGTALSVLIVACEDSDKKNQSGWAEENSSCITAACHGNASLVKNITVTGGASEAVPLFVDSALFVMTQHKSIKCVDCHTDIELSAGTHGPATKKFGGWARFSQKSGTVALATTDSTRNYVTAASTSCVNCHTAQNNPDAAHVKIPRLHTSVRNIGGHAVGENYEDNNCGRCHATCATCHFKSYITSKGPSAEDLIVQTNWDGVQTSGDNYNAVNWNDKTEWRMDWTTNVASHQFRNSDTLKATNEVCRSCHVGWYRPAQLGFAMRNGVVDSMYATGVKRHPQFQELNLGSVHQGTTCATCHGNTIHDQVSIAEGPECIDCHAGKDANHPTVNHMALSGGVKIKCIACHTKHRAADFAQNGENNWINPEDGMIGPVVVKYSELLNWYPHYMSKEVSCSQFCHYSGNRIGAHVITSSAEVWKTARSSYVVPYTGETDE